MKRFKYLTLAALVAFAACDEADEIVVPTVVTGSISGVVSIEGAGASGVTVTLSSGATATTDGSGAYAFSGVAAGAYTVQISGFASDAAFSSTAKAATISTAGQVATVSFDGSYVRTSAIFGSVAAGGIGLAGVSVGIGSASTTTDVNGQFSFTGLRSGSYTVTISGFDATMYSFGSTTVAVTLGVGESKPATFAGALMTNAMIKGSVFIDENDKDNTFSAGLESKLAVAGIPVGLETSPGDTTWTVTDAAGDYMFTDLAAAGYKVIVGNPAGVIAGLPGMLALGGSAVVGQAVTTGATAMVNFPFDIITQAVKVYGFLGTDAVDPGQTPIAGWTLNIYDTELNAAAGGATGRLGSVNTSAGGESIFRFARALDVSPNSATNDQVVFAQVAAAPTATHAISGETIIEIKYNPSDSVTMAPDTFDALYNALVVKVHAQEIDADTLALWNAVMRINKDSTFVTTVTDVTNVNGDAFWNLTPTAFPDTIWVRLSTTQAGAAGHAFTMAPMADEGTAHGRYLRYIWNGTTAASDTVDLGMEQVTYSDVDVVVNGHHEKDDSTGVTPLYSSGDDLTSVIGTQVQLYKTGTNTSVAGPVTGTATGLYGVVQTVANQAIGTYDLRARSLDANVMVLNDTMMTVVLDGSDQIVTVAPLKGTAGNSTFALKTNHNSITGVVIAKDVGATPVKDVIVTVAPTSGNIQGSAMMVDTTSALGAYAFMGLIEGPYTVTVADIAGSWEFFDTLKTATLPRNSGSADNTDGHVGSRDLEGYGVTLTANYQPHKMDTKIQGVIVNDRDGDLNTIDSGEALIGSTVELIDDTDKDGVVDSGETTVVATTTTDANGAYEFTPVREGFYHVKAADASAYVTRALNGATGAHTATLSLSTSATPAAAAPADGANSTDRVGTMDPASIGLGVLPSWNYATDVASLVSTTHFTFLKKAVGIVQGGVFDTATGLVGQAGVTMILTRCFGQGVAPSPPIAGAVCTKIPGTERQTTTTAAGAYSFDSLDEGVYQVEVVPASIGLTTISLPVLPFQVYHATIQLASSPTDTETVPNFLIN